MYDEREQDSFGIGDALVSLALILGGGAAGRKMAGKNAMPSKKELSDLLAAIKASGSQAFNNPQQGLDIPAATFGDYVRAYQRSGQQGAQNIKGAAQRVLRTPVVNPLAAGPKQLSLDLPGPTISDAVGYVKREVQPSIEYADFTNPFSKEARLKRAAAVEAERQAAIQAQKANRRAAYKH